MKKMIVLLICMIMVLLGASSAQASLANIGDQSGVNWCYDTDSVRIKNENIGQCFYVTICWSYDQPQTMKGIDELVDRLFLHMALVGDKYTILSVTVNQEAGGMQEPITITDDKLVWEPIMKDSLLQQTQQLIRKSIIYYTQR